MSVVAFIRRCIAEGADIDSALSAAEQFETGGLFGDVSLFPAFWSAYPNKVGKGDAEKAYKRALKRARHQTIMEGLERANQRGWSESLGNPPHPSTWLNRDRWADNPTPRAILATPGMMAAASDEMAYQALVRKYEHGGRSGDLGGTQGASRSLPAPSNGSGRLL
jgi:hypothetical protein